ncbi:MAG: leucine-rich repeat domain-containing protein [Candidatus Aminicenantes bacterium]|nr:MAG: leucine-rich repeat domain-containing protein [Candidatus Aminicenantes bacterium]
MSKDLEIIKELEIRIYRKLDHRYSMDENEKIIGLELYRLEISDISLLKDLKNLTHLDLTNNQISDISSLKDLKNLTHLDLHYNLISDISFLKDLKNLTYLDLHGNEISDISSLKDLKNLTHLYLNDNQISDISSLKDLKNLTYLDLHDNRISDISSLKDLKNLIHLNLVYNQISDISSLKDLKNLTYLDLHDNRISDISSLKDLKNLIHLNLVYNQISDISSIKHLENLTHLYLNDNQISDISPLKDLENLYHLVLTNNEITELPVEIFNFKGNLLNIFGANPIEFPPMEIIKKGKEAVKAYFESLEGKKRILNEVKMLLVGDGGAGKTSLVKRLLIEKFDQNEPQTHGININHWEVEQGESKVKVNIWDFGGQEIMHATHQFFLSKRSLYVLVLDGRKDEKTEYWLKHVKSFGGDSPVLVVINKIDTHPGFDVNRLFLMEKYKNIKGFFRLSCASGEGIESFSQKLIHELVKVELIYTTWAETWFKVKTRLEKMNKDFITYDEYKTLCMKENIITKISQDTLVDFLHDLGVVLHFKDFKLQETHVINPEWVTTAVYKIINSKDLAESKGLLKLNLLEKILKQEKDTDYYYPRDKYRFIIDLMQKFELCYEIDSETILIPDLLEIQEPSFDFDYAPALKFLIQYDFLPRSIMPRFIVKMHKDIKNELNWRTGAVLENKSFNSTAVVKSDNEEKRIHIYVQGEQKRDYFSAILHTFREINSSFEKLEAIEKVPMPDEPGITVSYKHLIRLEQKGREYYEPDGSEKEYNVKQLLGTVDKNMYNQLLDQLIKEFKILSKLEPQKRGFEFEKFLNRLFELYDLNPRNSFKNTGEQIDGSFQMDNDTFLVEAKWQKNKIGQDDLLVFDGKISRKAKWTRGLFISISGFSDDGQIAFSKGQSTSIIGMDSSDLEYILDRKLTLPEAISLKLRHTAETNDFFAPLPELKKNTVT